MLIYLNSRCVDIKFLENGKGLFEELTADANVSNIRGIVVVKTIDILSNTRCISLHSCQDQQILQVTVN